MTERLTDAAIREAKHASAMAQLAEVVALTEATTPGLAIETLDVNCRGMKVKFTHPKTDTVNMSNPQYVRLAFRSFGAFAGHLKQALEEVERLTRERDEAHENLTRLASYALCGTGGVEDVGHPPESHEPPTGIVPRTAYDAIGKWRAEVARLRAAALPEDAEEIVFKELSIGVFEPQDLEIQEAIHAKRRAKARAVVKALRRDA